MPRSRASVAGAARHASKRFTSRPSVRALATSPGALRVLGFEEHVCHAIAGTLCLGAEVRLRGAASVGVRLERQIEAHEVYPLAVLLHDALQRRVEHPAKGTLKIHELDDVDLPGHVALADAGGERGRGTHHGPNERRHDGERAERAPRPGTQRAVRNVDRRVAEALDEQRRARCSGDDRRDVRDHAEPAKLSDDERLHHDESATEKGAEHRGPRRCAPQRRRPERQVTARRRTRAARALAAESDRSSPSRSDERRRSRSSPRKTPGSSSSNRW